MAERSRTRTGRIPWGRNLSDRFDFHRGSFGGQIAAVVKLAAAIAAVEKASAGKAFEQIQKADVHGIDAVAFLQFDDAIGSAGRTTGVRIEMEPVAARDKFFYFAVFTSINRHVAKALDKSAMHTVQLPSALATLVHSMLFITQFA